VTAQGKIFVDADRTVAVLVTIVEAERTVQPVPFRLTIAEEGIVAVNATAVAAARSKRGRGALVDVLAIAAFPLAPG
jgi:hypothetical protein